jgi:HEAT repeat protein
MTEATHLPPELSRSVAGLARALVAAARSVALYPAAHPAVASSLQRLRAAVHASAAEGVVSLGVTPDTLLVDGLSLPTPDGPVAEAAALLHGRDILQIGFAPEVSAETLAAFLGVLALDAETLRARGGPARVWEGHADPAIAIEQIDYGKVLEDREVRSPVTRKDELWRSIVQSVIERRKSLDEAAQRRLLEIAGDVGAIGELAADVMAPNHAVDGSPMLTSQAAAVLAAYRHLTGIVSVLAPERREEVMSNLAAATANLDPHLVMQLMRSDDESDSGSGGVGVVRGIAAAFDDLKVAQLLATTLALEGQASARLAEVFDTIAPDEPRKRRVLTLTRSLLTETDFGRSSQFQTLWSSMEELLVSYNERPFVSEQYRAGLDEIGTRADAMAAHDLPAELDEWVETLGQDNVRRLSVTLLIDLLNLERDARRAPELALDVAGLADDLLMAGDYEAAASVVGALARAAADRQGVMSGPSRVALDQLAASAGIREVIALLGDLEEPEFEPFRAICDQLGPAAVDALIVAIGVEEASLARRRATDLIVRCGAAGVSRLAPLVGSPTWYVQRNAADLLGRIAAPEGVPLLQPLLRSADSRVTKATVRALAAIDDPAAARAVHTVLRASTGDLRKAVVAALVAEQDPRVVPVLVRILNESEPLGADHVIVLETLEALGRVGNDDAVPPVATLMKRRSWFARKKVRALKQASLTTLRDIGTPAAAAALDAAARQGDRLLRKLARTVPHA